MSNNIRNITIIAHVDHGKTTLIDNLMKQSGSFRDNEVVDERLMDSGELEKERGITILAKPASINWNNSRINIIDTPGHRDFAAEVERVLSMADGALLLIDSAEGVMPQTKFVLSKALKQGLKPIVVINKLDKADQRANEVLDETFDLFVSLDANEEQLDFPVLYASGRSGWADHEVDGPRENLNPLLDLIVDHVKPAELDKTKPFAMLSTLLYADSFLGRSLVGRIAQGTAKANQQIKAINLEGKKVDEGRLTKNEIEGLRANPTLLFTNQSSPIAITKTQLAAASNAYKNEEYEKAKTLAVSAYLDGFELIENSLDARDKDLRKSIEGNLIKLRQVLSNAQQVNQFESLMEITVGQLHDAEELLTETTLSNEALFTASLVILLREGLEALLVVLALITVLIRTKRHDALKYVHFGWFSALLAGFATWAVAQSIINISGASREVMEGIAAMVAAVMLFYVGIWMHSKTNAEHWQAYIQKHINSQLEAGTLWGLAVLSFIAVYREVFETVLFYQSLVTQASTTQYSFVISGFLFGVAVLSILAWGMFRYSVKLPIARFFSTTTYLLLVLSFILMGKAISALQEAAIIGITPLPINVEVTWFGIGSTWQGITAQVTILILFSLYMYRSRNRNAS